MEAAIPFEKGPGGCSKWATKFFVRGNEDKVAEALAKWPAETPIELVFAPGKVKDDKVDDGHFQSYWWNVTDLAPSTEGTPAKLPVQAPIVGKEPLFGDDEDPEAQAPVAKRPPQPAGYWDDKDRIIGASCAVSVWDSVEIAAVGAS